MSNSTNSLLSETEEIIKFAETIENRIQDLSGRLEKIRFRLSIILNGFIFGMPIGVSLAIFADKRKSELYWLQEPVTIIISSFVAIAFISGSVVYLSYIFSEQKFLRRELSRERAILAKLVEMADRALSELGNTLSLSQRALLETRLQRIAFERL